MTNRGSHDPALQVVKEAAHPIVEPDHDLDALFEAARRARLVLIGEASHGTHEFYDLRARLTRRLIVEAGFAGVAAEADWPDALRVNRFVHGRGDDATPEAALGDFERFPTWMWRNTVVLDFVAWLRDYNTRRPAGFYGLDLYSLDRSIESVLNYLDQVDPMAAARARFRYGCFEDFGEDPQAYGYAAAFNLDAACESQVIQQLIDLQQHAGDRLRLDGQRASDEEFYAEQNARVVKNAEQYYRAMFGDQVESWNLRDRHMAEAIDALLAHLSRNGTEARLVVWAHNSHLGDAHATAMSVRGELNVGQLVRQRYGRECFSIGFTTYTGTVTAAEDWGAPARRRQVRPGLPGSYEALFHAAGLPRFWLDLRAPGPAGALRQPRLERAIGVIYRPETERLSHYFDARLSEQFDAVIHLDETRALEPLDRSPHWERGEVPETFPTGI